ncbi:uncharacterized protein DUF397 [Haloactinospora alba]|uniref:Uncharacterized protein DUF397 n=1 Tax=Haloactinospora alba TaxID=405555 RepID=A0A543NNZ0_9ACTN|nr:DUF397 domain-containing protein [Haloactinospora alba]TQN33554.1 uncharacterized protein DUF397 [Haloactinospora alba]
MFDTSHLAFHKSSYSSATQENCVEVAEGPVTAVRDTQNRDAGHLSFSATEWKAFLEGVRSGRL